MRTDRTLGVPDRSGQIFAANRRRLPPTTYHAPGHYCPAPRHCWRQPNACQQVLFQRCPQLLYPHTALLPHCRLHILPPPTTFPSCLPTVAWATTRCAWRL